MCIMYDRIAQIYHLIWQIWKRHSSVFVNFLRSKLILCGRAIYLSSQSPVRVQCERSFVKMYNLNQQKCSSSQVCSINTAIACGATGCESRVPSAPMLLLKSSVPEITLDKKLTANCLIETHTKLQELIPALLVKYRLKVHSYNTAIELRYRYINYISAASHLNITAF